MKLNEYSMALVELMTMCGLVIKNTRVDLSGMKRPKWDIAQDFNKRTMYLFIDGLSLNHLRSLQKRISTLPLSVVDTFEQNIIFKEH